MLSRIKATLPHGWAGDTSPNVDSLLTGGATAATLTQANIDAAKLQTRLATATGSFLDIASLDFFGKESPRIPSETDAYFSTRIRATLFKPKVTYEALGLAVNAAMAGSGITIATYEYGTGVNSIPANSFPVGLNINDALARYGSNLLPFEAMVTISGIAPEAAILMEDGSTMLQEDGVLAINMENAFSIYQYLYNIIMSVKPIGTTVWVSIT